MKRLLTLPLLIIGFSLNAQTAKEIIEKADELTRGVSSQGEMTIQIIRPKWSREMKMKSWTLGTEYSLILITAPAKEKGTVFLKREKEIWNWVPSIERTVKLPPSMMMQSWMGTDLTNDDLVKESSIVEDYTHEIEKDTVIDGRECWKLILTAKPDAPVVWGSINAYVDKKNYIQMCSEFYDEDGFLVNVFTASDIKEMGGKTLAGRLEIEPVEEEGHKTVIIQNDIQFNTGIEKDFFTTSQMKRLK
jgi:outer membrane lipoprotein-sorting protein